MAVQYDEENGWSGFLVNILEAKKEIIDLGDEFKKFQEVANSEEWDFEYFYNSHSRDEIEEWIEKLDLSDESLKTFLEDWDGSGDIAEAFQAHMQQSAQSMTLFQRGAQLAGTALKSFVALATNMALSFGASFVISKVAEGITWVYKQISGKAAEEAKQKIKELGEEAQSSIDSIISSLEENTKTINDVKQKYAELAQGINNLGKVSQNQGTLSNDEYSEFLDISNQLAELFPQLTVGYDDNGNAILNLSGNVGTITGQLNDLIEAEKELAAQKIRNDIGATWDAFGENIEESENKISSLEETIKTYSNALSEFQKISSGGQVYMNSSSIDQYAEAFKAVGIIKSDANFFDKKDNKYLLEARNSDGLMGIDFSKLSKTQKDKIEGYLKQTVQSYNTQLEAAQNELVNRNKEFSTNVIASVMDSDAYQNTDNKSIIDTILTNYDYTQLYKDFDGNWENAYNYLYNQIIGAFDGQNGKEIQNIWNNLLSIDTDTALAENIPKIEAYIKQLAELLNIDWTKLAPALGYDLEAYKQKIKTAKERLGFNYSTDARDRQNASIQEKNRKINELTQGLTDKELEILATVDIPDDILEYSEKKFKKWIAEQSNSAEIEVKIDVVEPLDSTISAFSDLDDIYKDIHNNTSVSAASIAKLNEAFGDVKLRDSTNALEHFKEVLTTMPDDVEAQQQALNELATAYIDNSELLANLTEDNAEYTASELKKIGVQNAEEVVQTRLSKSALNLQNAEEAQKKTIDVINASMKKYVNESEKLEAAKRRTAVASIDLEDATADELVQLYNEANAAGIDATAILNLLAEKVRANQSILSTGGDIQNLISLCKALDGTTTYLAKFAEAKAIVARGGTIKGNGTADEAYLKGLQDLANKEINDVLAQYGQGDQANIEFVPTIKDPTSGGSSDTEKQFEESIDWIEVMLQRLDENISRLEDRVGDIYTSWSDRNWALYQEMQTVKQGMDVAAQAYNRYMQEADKYRALIGDDYANKVISGELDIETITDETLKNNIDLFRQWYEKAMEANDKVHELQDSLMELAQTEFDNVTKQFEDMAKSINHTYNMIDEFMRRIEAQGYLVDESYLIGQLNSKNGELDTLKQKLSGQIAAFNDAVANGMEEGSEQWNNMVQDIQATEEEINKAETDIVDLNNAIRQLKWDRFDIASDRINNVINELGFLKDLLGDDLYDDNGAFNDNGQAVADLALMGYDTYMGNAERIASEIADID